MVVSTVKTKTHHHHNHNYNYSFNYNIDDDVPLLNTSDSSIQQNHNKKAYSSDKISYSYG